MESQPMKDNELGQFVCTAQGGCLHTPQRTITSDGVWVKSPGPDPLNPGSHIYSSAHRDCYESWVASRLPEFRMTVSLTNAAFHDPDDDDVLILDTLSEMVADVAAQLKDGMTSGNLRDGSNGGPVGHWEVVKD